MCIQLSGGCHKEDEIEFVQRVLRGAKGFMQDPSHQCCEYSSVNREPFNVAWKKLETP